MKDSDISILELSIFLMRQSTTKSFKKSVLLFSILSLSHSWAEIPSMEAVGVYNATKNDLKEFSPLWGFVALKGGLLENIRFFGNYTKAPDPTLDNPTRTKDVAQDPIAKLIQDLFPSPDGVNFVANEGSGFIGDV